MLFPGRWVCAGLFILSACQTPAPEEARPSLSLPNTCSDEYEKFESFGLAYEYRAFAYATDGEECAYGLGHGSYNQSVADTRAIRGCVIIAEELGVDEGSCRLHEQREISKPVEKELTGLPNKSVGPISQTPLGILAYEVDKIGRFDAFDAYLNPPNPRQILIQGRPLDDIGSLMIIRHDQTYHFPGKPRVKHTKVYLIRMDQVKTTTKVEPMFGTYGKGIYEVVINCAKFAGACIKGQNAAYPRIALPVSGKDKADKVSAAFDRYFSLFRT